MNNNEMSLENKILLENYYKLQSEVNRIQQQKNDLLSDTRKNSRKNFFKKLFKNA